MKAREIALLASFLQLLVVKKSAPPTESTYS
jgi:hypothetical protein